MLILFSISWSVGSVLEGVPRAASMGLLLFGFSGMVLKNKSATKKQGSQLSGGKILTGALYIVTVLCVLGFLSQSIATLFAAG